MRAYLILTLKWAITLVLTYCIYSTGHTYTAIALIWLMAWYEALAILIGQVLRITQETNTAMVEYGMGQAKFAGDMAKLFREMAEEIGKEE